MTTRPQTNSSEVNLGGLAPPEADAGLSLDQLNQAFASMLGGGADPYAPVIEPVEEIAVGEPPPETWQSAESTSDDDCEITPRSIFEAMLFVGHPQNEPLTSAKVAGLMRGVRPAEIDELVVELNDLYRRENRPYQVASRGEGFELVLRDEFAPVRNLLQGRVRQHRLSAAALEILSLVAYHNAISADEINRLRGIHSNAVLNQMVRRQLLSVEKTDTKPRQLIYRTTKRFLELFGLSSLDDLPKSQDIDRR